MYVILQLDFLSVLNSFELFNQVSTLRAEKRVYLYTSGF